MSCEVARCFLACCVLDVRFRRKKLGADNRKDRGNLLVRCQRTLAIPVTFFSYGVILTMPIVPYQKLEEDLMGTVGMDMLIF